MTRYLSLMICLLPVLAATEQQSPYAGQESRHIKSLSDSEIQSLRRGEGMGFAKVAELNHYPGPRHVLELADKLGLTDSQRTDTGALYEIMHKQAVALGEKLIGAESDLDRQFADQSVTTQSLRSTLLEIGRLRAELRYVHLKTHLEQRELLTPRQLRHYDKFRGYRGNDHDHARR